MPNWENLTKDFERGEWENVDLLCLLQNVLGTPNIFGKGYLGPYSSAKFHTLTRRVGAREIFKYFRNLYRVQKTAPTFEETVNNIDAEIVPRDTGIANIWYTGVKCSTSPLSIDRGPANLKQNIVDF